VAIFVIPEQKSVANMAGSNSTPPGYVSASSMRGFVHDLSNLLTGVLGYTSLLMRSKDDALNPQLRNFVTVIEETTLRAIGLATRLGEVAAAAQAGIFEKNRGCWNGSEDN
jgi:signal transduction histidine kinase